MSEAATAAPSERAGNIARELRVSGRLMTLDPGLFCIVHTPAGNVDGATAMPGVRISLPPGPAGRPEAVSIATFRDDGFLYGFGDAALVRVVGAPAQVLVTIYQLPEVQGAGPNLQVLKLVEGAPAAARSAPAPAAAAAATPVDMIAHIQGRGDVGAKFGEWLGEKGSKRWIEGFAIAPAKDIAVTDIEYQAVLGRGWLSPWAEGGQFCGSRGMALPLLGLRVRLRGAAAQAWDCSYSASFIDGTTVGPVDAGEACESEAWPRWNRSASRSLPAARQAHACLMRGTRGARRRGARPESRRQAAGAKPTPKPKVGSGLLPPRRRAGARDARGMSASAAARIAPAPPVIPAQAGSVALQNRRGQLRSEDQQPRYLYELPFRASELSRPVPAYRQAPAGGSGQPDRLHLGAERQRIPAFAASATRCRNTTPRRCSRNAPRLRPRPAPRREVADCAAQPARPRLHARYHHRPSWLGRIA